MTNLMIPEHLPSLEMLQQELKDFPFLDPLAIHTLNQLVRAAKKVVSLLEQDLRRYGLSRGRYTTLWVVLKRGEVGVTPAEIADELDVTRATMTGLLDAIERDGQIVRVRSTDDRRNVIVKITDKGRAQLAKLVPDHYLNIADAMATLSVPEKNKLLDMLRRLEEGAKAFARPRRKRPPAIPATRTAARGKRAAG
ncbi:MAG: MarR family transcriptional regulator [Sinimarinibacterium sp.]|jgi:DNA-binding MarR family transcriptional regulator